jgi:PAS domain S-box-containing protein
MKELHVPDPFDTAEDLIQHSKKKIGTQIKEFVGEAGKKFALTITFIVVLLFSGQAVPSEQAIMVYTVILMIVFGILLYIVWWLGEKKNQQLFTDIIGIAKNQKKIGDNLSEEIVKLELRLVGRIKILEQYTPYAIFEFDTTTQRIIHVNEQFESITGWSKKEANEEIDKIPEDQRPLALVKMFIQEEQQLYVQELIRARLSGEDLPKQHILWYRRKNGEVFPARLAIHVFYEGGRRIIQGFISDDTEMRDMKETIRAQKGLIDSLTNEFARVYTGKQKGMDLIEELKKQTKKSTRGIRQDVRL